MYTPGTESSNHENITTTRHSTLAKSMLSFRNFGTDRVRIVVTVLITVAQYERGQSSHNYIECISTAAGHSIASAVVVPVLPIL
jgi:hypothetical protein